MSTSALGTALDALVAGLAALAALDGVAVVSGDIPLEDGGLEAIVLGDCELEDVALTMGGGRQETWTVEGVIRAAKPWDGTTETTIAAARDRCLEIFAQLETYLNDTYTSQVPDISLESASLQQYPDPEQRVAVLLFKLSVLNVKNP